MYYNSIAFLICEVEIFREGYKLLFKTTNIVVWEFPFSAQGQHALCNLEKEVNGTCIVL